MAIRPAPFIVRAGLSFCVARPRLLPTGERQPEVIQPMRQQPARDRYAKRIAIGEVRQAPLYLWMFLAENHVAPGAVQRLPGPHPLAPGCVASRWKIASPTRHLAEDGDRPQTGQGDENLLVGCARLGAIEHV
jgi:hypothetical protein